MAATIPGDATLKGAVDNLDHNVLLQSLSSSTVQGVARWQDGDFNYDSYVDTKDISLFLGHQGGLHEPGPSGVQYAAGQLDPAGRCRDARAVGRWQDNRQYNAVTGLLTLDDSGANYDAAIGSD